ncbi:MAG: D-glycero-beta-D-manno-heptose-7-phosphate kinase [Candidatus Neomarinimicrobiota bacterium]|nr:MAG: D-glycero-beta-D-manno-heptose-7-phosphate kinase [Candidatus Neomarinimicrobiota bacterium]
MQSNSYLTAIENFSRSSVLVIGDLMLDAYVWGDTVRISPEAPVPVVEVQSQEHMPGGAANVARNLRELGAKVWVAGLIGLDSEGTLLKEKLASSGIHTDLILSLPSRPTSVKTRIIARNQHVVRYDREETEAIPEDTADRLVASLADNSTWDGIIIEDYNKGLFTSYVITRILDFAHERSIPVYVDPKWEEFRSYKGVRLFKPNWGEFHAVVGPSRSDEEFLTRGRSFRAEQELDILMVTRGKEGVTLFADDLVFTIPTHARQVHDVSGAGDTVIATFTLGDLNRLTPEESARLANLAAGIVCEEVGVVPITKSGLIQRLHEIQPED